MNIRPNDKTRLAAIPAASENPNVSKILARGGARRVRAEAEGGGQGRRREDREKMVQGNRTVKRLKDNWKTPKPDHLFSCPSIGAVTRSSPAFNRRLPLSLKFYPSQISPLHLFAPIPYRDLGRSRDQDWLSLASSVNSLGTGYSTEENIDCSYFHGETEFLLSSRLYRGIFTLSLSAEQVLNLHQVLHLKGQKCCLATIGQSLPKLMTIRLFGETSFTDVQTSRSKDLSEKRLLFLPSLVCVVLSQPFSHDFFPRSSQTNRPTYGRPTYGRPTYGRPTYNTKGGKD
ncbi:hypothetical protein PoB_002011900 [Plakobranchus ocellatus]|uniref:Uncharacterized protein n=1 Tax=Plakobranchus ocellatus TaxID=259542 RepID=A0AAV3ZE26_9GAST|nr:hypothetical protein PoB_002011900 [Plakobranchus ocellatus]